MKQARAKALYDEDLALPVRKSHKNYKLKLYADFLGEPNEKAHHLLHNNIQEKNGLNNYR
ncbi:MAG: iron hydrogenase small subunit [Streptococcus sp.]